MKWTRIEAGRYEGDWGLHLRRINSQVWGLFDNKGQELYRSDSKWRLTLGNMKAYLEPIPQIPGEWTQVTEREWHSEGGWTIHDHTTMCDKIEIMTLPPMYIPQEQREPFIRVFNRFERAKAAIEYSFHPRIVAYCCKTCNRLGFGPANGCPICDAIARAKEEYQQELFPTQSNDTLKANGIE